MLILKTEGPQADLATNCAQAELDNWERLIFSFDMDKDTVNPGDNANRRNTRRSRSVSQPSTAATGSNEGFDGLTSQDHDALAQFAAAAAAGNAQSGEMSYEQLAQTLRSMHGLQGNYPYVPPAQNFAPNYLPREHMGHPHTQPPPSSYAWAQHPTQQPLQSQYDRQQHSYQYHPGISQFPYGSPQQQLPPINTNTDPRSRASTSRAAMSASPSTSPTDTMDQTEEGISISEDKRRRNTAASARFRIKKKQRSLNLDRSVSDLTGRADELEREATELRRENGWLKEIVMLKGRSLSRTTRAVEGSREDRKTSDEESEESDGEDSDDASKKRTKAKGKGKGKTNK